MFCDLSLFNLNNKVVAVAVSGGSDSVALLHFLCSSAKNYNFIVKAINVEHGIRGKESLNDSIFVKNLCKTLNVPLLAYSVDAPSYSMQNKISLEEGARALRYNCFFKAIESGFCDVVATAHHLKDNAETILFNLFRGSGLKGLTGINDFEDKIIRPFINVDKSEIEEYINQNNLAFITDKTNFEPKYSRNYIRLNVLPVIEKAFPEALKSIERFSAIAKDENDYLELETLKIITLSKNKAEILIGHHKALVKRAIIVALKHLGIEKDWEKIHIDQVFSLIEKENGKEITLPKNVVATREYDKLVLTKSSPLPFISMPFSLTTFFVQDTTYKIEEVKPPVDLKSGLFIDFNKVSPSAVIRFRQTGDEFSKFGGGTVSLSDYFTDNKISPSKRDFIPLLAEENKILAIFGVAISSAVKVDSNTKKIIKLT